MIRIGDARICTKIKKLGWTRTTIEQIIIQHFDYWIFNSAISITRKFNENFYSKNKIQ